MNDTDGEIAGAPRSRLNRIVAWLLHAHETRDALLRKSDKAEQKTGAVPADLLVALSHAERALLAVEAEVLDAVYAVIATDRLSNTVQQKDGDT